MARPQKFTLDFFVHDASARSDRKVRSLRRKHGNDGYATYFCLLEMLCSEDGIKLNLSNPLDLETVVEECGLRDEAHFYKVVQTCIDIGLFDKQLWESDRLIFSHGLHNRYLKRLEDRKQAALRKNRQSDAKKLQKRITEIEADEHQEEVSDEIVTGKTEVITRDNSVGARDNSPELQNFRTSELQNPEIRTTEPHNSEVQREESEAISEDSSLSFSSNASLPEPEASAESTARPVNQKESTAASNTGLEIKSSAAAIFPRKEKVELTSTQMIDQTSARLAYQECRWNEIYALYRFGLSELWHGPERHDWHPALISGATAYKVKIEQPHGLHFVQQYIRNLITKGLDADLESRYREGLEIESRRQASQAAIAVDCDVSEPQSFEPEADDTPEAIERRTQHARNLKQMLLDRQAQRRAS